MQLLKESLKKSGLPGFEPWLLRYRCSALTNWANKPTGSWLNWFVIYPGKTKMRGSSLHLFLHSAVQIYEFHIFIISCSSFWSVYLTVFLLYDWTLDVYSNYFGCDSSMTWQSALTRSFVFPDRATVNSIQRRKEIACCLLNAWGEKGVNKFRMPFSLFHQRR